MATDAYRVWVWEEEDLAAIKVLGDVEETWAAMIKEIIAQDHVSSAIFNGAIMCWPTTLYRKLEWGDLPHFGNLGGISSWEAETIMESFDSVMAQVIASSGRTAWTDMAWRRIAMLHTPQGPCPDCGQYGPANQMAEYGAIFACNLCEDVIW